MWGIFSVGVPFKHSSVLGSELVVAKVVTAPLCDPVLLAWCNSGSHARTWLLFISSWSVRVFLFSPTTDITSGGDFKGLTLSWSLSFDSFTGSGVVFLEYVPESQLVSDITEPSLGCWNLMDRTWFDKGSINCFWKRSISFSQVLKLFNFAFSIVKEEFNFFLSKLFFICEQVDMLLTGSDFGSMRILCVGVEVILTIEICFT